MRVGKREREREGEKGGMERESEESSIWAVGQLLAVALQVNVNKCISIKWMISNDRKKKKQQQQWQQVRPTDEEIEIIDKQSPTMDFCAFYPRPDFDVNVTSPVFGLGTMHNVRIHSIWFVGIFSSFWFPVRKFCPRFCSVDICFSLCVFLLNVHQYTPKALQVIDCIK